MPGIPLALQQASSPRFPILQLESHPLHLPTEGRLVPLALAKPLSVHSAPSSLHEDGCPGEENEK